MKKDPPITRDLPRRPFKKDLPMETLSEACEFVDGLKHGESLVIGHADDDGRRYVLMTEATYLTMKEQLLRLSVIDAAGVPRPTAGGGVVWGPEPEDWGRG